MNKIGLGTWLITDYEELKETIKAANEFGYRTLDTAQVYNNEEMIGNIFEQLELNTDEWFITTKVTPLNYKNFTTKSVMESLKRLKIKTIDLVLLHAEIDLENSLRAYEELLELKNQGIIKNVGLSNFSIETIKILIEKTGEKPYCNQIVCSPTTRPIQLEEYCKENDIKLVGYSIMKPYFGANPFYENSEMTNKEKEMINQISSEYNISVAQLLNGWALQNGYYIIPKSTKKDRIYENLNSKINLNPEHMDVLNNMNRLNTEQYKNKVESWRDSITDEMFEVGYLV